MLQVLGGQMHACSDNAVWRKEECVGEAEGMKRVWRAADINFDWFGGAMQAVWVIACSNDWPVLLWQAIDATGQTTGPVQNNNLAVPRPLHLLCGSVIGTGLQ